MSLMIPATNGRSHGPSLGRPEVESPTSTGLREALIIVMGPTGAGKSTFINVASNSKLRVSDSLESCTQHIEHAPPFTLDDYSVTLIDTPGFDDTTRSDEEILHTMCEYLAKEYSENRILHGVLYMQRISDNRMSGTATRNLRFFQDLCGPEALSNSIVVTTMWANVDRAKGEARETELKTKDAFFKPVLSAGGRMMRHENTVSSAHAILRAMLRNTPKALRLQRELVDQQMAPWQTAAGATMLQELAQLEQKQADRVAKLREEQAEAAKQSDAEWQREIEEEAQELEEERKKLAEAKKKLVDLQIEQKKRVEEQLEQKRRLEQQQLEQKKRAEQQLEQKKRAEQLAVPAVPKAAVEAMPPPAKLVTSNAGASIPASLRPAAPVPTGLPSLSPPGVPTSASSMPQMARLVTSNAGTSVPAALRPAEPTPTRPAPVTPPTASSSSAAKPMTSATGAQIPSALRPAAPAPPAGPVPATPPSAVPAPAPAAAPSEPHDEPTPEPEKKKKAGIAHKFAAGFQRIFASLFSCFGSGGDPDRHA